MLKRGLFIILVILLIFSLTYFSPQITSLSFFSKEDKIVYSSEILSLEIQKTEFLSQTQLKALIKNRESINFRLFIQVKGEKGTEAYYDASLLEAKSSQYLTFSFNPEKTGTFIQSMTITPYLQLENKKLIYRFSSTSFQINQEIPEETIQEDQLQQRTMQQILTAPLITENFFVYANGLIASQANSGNTHYYYKDNLGSTRAITDATGSVIYTASYKPFGTSILETGNSEYTYTGKSQ